MTDREITIKRLKMRSMRRGIREMDLILQVYAAEKIEVLGDDDLVLYEALLAENDQEFYSWITQGGGEPDRYIGLMTQIRAIADGVARPV